MASVLWKGSAAQLERELPAVGQSAPDFSLVANDLSAVSLADSAGKVRLIHVIPSVDTPVCSLSTKKFNADLDSLPDNVIGYTVSVDTPFAQKRWCAAEGVDKMKTLSDFKTHEFMKDYGVYLTDVGISARAIFVVDADGKLAYTQLVPNIGSEPDYDEVLSKVKELAG